MEQRVFIRITIPSVEIAEAVRLKTEIEELLKDIPDAFCEMSVTTPPKPLEYGTE